MAALERFSHFSAPSPGLPQNTTTLSVDRTIVKGPPAADHLHEDIKKTLSHLTWERVFARVAGLSALFRARVVKARCAVAFARLFKTLEIATPVSLCSEDGTEIV